LRTNSFGIGAILAACAAAIAIAVVASEAGDDIDPTSAPASQGTLVQDRTGGADCGTDPFVPVGVWTP
jgi:hypothetical protein